MSGRVRSGAIGFVSSAITSAYMRYDERGCGMTDRNVGDLSLDRWVEDLEDVVERLICRSRSPSSEFLKEAAICVAYAVKHPERVSNLVLYGAIRARRVSTRRS